MHTITYPFNSGDCELIKETLFKKKGTIVYPTETYYGLGCASNVSDAVKKIYRLKQRKKKMPLLVLIDDWQMLRSYAANVSEDNLVFLKKHWPGALTAVLETQDNLAKELNYSGSTLGFRMTSSPIARDLIQAIGVPLVGTSANRSIEPEISDFSVVQEAFGDQVDLYIDGGATPGKLPSTIIDMTQSEGFSIIRQGLIKLP